MNLLFVSFKNWWFYVYVQTCLVVLSWFKVRWLNNGFDLVETVSPILKRTRMRPRNNKFKRPPYGRGLMKYQKTMFPWTRITTLKISKSTISYMIWEGLGKKRGKTFPSLMAGHSWKRNHIKLNDLVMGPEKSVRKNIKGIGLGKKNQQGAIIPSPPEIINCLSLRYLPPWCKHNHVSSL